MYLNKISLKHLTLSNFRVIKQQLKDCLDLIFVSQKMIKKSF